MTQNNYLCETDQFILKPNNQLSQKGSGGKFQHGKN